MPKRTKRLRKVPPREIHVSPFNWGTLINVAAIVGSMLTVGFYFSVNYATTADTLKRHDQQLVEEKVEREKMKALDDEKREGLRRALENYAATTSTGIAELAKHAAVTDEHIKSIDEHLGMVVNGLQRLETARPLEGRVK